MSRMTPAPLPDCPHCSAANTLRTAYHVMSQHIAECSCCTKYSRIDGDEAKPLMGRLDVSGNQIEGDY